MNKTKKLISQKFSTREITITGMLIALTATLGFTGLGYIPIQPFKLTIMHIPVIIGSLIEGPVIGAILGFTFGLSSIFQAIRTPSPVSYIFLNPLVSILPRILIGITPCLMYKALKRIKVESVRTIISIVVGSFTNTIGVLGIIYALYLKEYCKVLGIGIDKANKTFLLLILNGYVSATAAVLVSLPVIQAVKRYTRNK